MDKLSFMSRLDDLINPITIKEMRQAVKGRFITWSLIIFLVVQLAIIGIVLMMRVDFSEDFNIGRNIFSAMLAVLLLTCLFFVPAFVALRFSAERSDSNVDLFFITTLRPIRIIWGKLSAALVLTLLFFSASMPFMTLTYLLRGLDLPSVFILLALDFLVVAAGIQFGIFLASFPGKVIARTVRFLGGLFILIVVFQLTLVMSFGILSQGVGGVIGTWGFWWLVSFIVMITGLLFVLSATIITPASANKAFVVRLYLLFLWFAAGVLSILFYWRKKDDNILHTWALFIVIISSVNLFVAICERQKWGPRVARKIPKSRILRIPAFLLFSGAAGGIAFSVIMTLVTFVVLFCFSGNFRMFVLMRGSSSGVYLEELIKLILFLSLYAFCYSVTALFIKNVFFRRSSRAALAAIIALFLLAGGCVIPVIIGFFVRTTPWFEISAKWFIGNPLIVLWDEDIWVDCLWLSSIWSICIFVVMLPWFISQVRSFKAAGQKQIQQENK
jgi:hypothetical protein